MAPTLHRENIRCEECERNGERTRIAVGLNELTNRAVSYVFRLLLICAPRSVMGAHGIDPLE